MGHSGGKPWVAPIIRRQAVPAYAGSQCPEGPCVFNVAGMECNGWEALCPQSQSMCSAAASCIETGG